MIHEFFDPSTGCTTATANSNQHKVRQQHEYGTFQAKVTAAATVKLQGRLSPDADWVDIATVTASGITVVALCPLMRVNVSGNTGIVYAWLAE